MDLQNKWENDFKGEAQCLICFQIIQKLENNFFFVVYVYEIFFVCISFHNNKYLIQICFLLNVLVFEFP